MRISKLALASLLAASALGLSACASSLSTTVSRYQAMPAPQGQTFLVVPGEGMAAPGGLEFERYAALVAQQLAARGYAPATDAKSANMIVHLGYSVDTGQVRYDDPFYGGYGGFGGFGGYGGFGRSYYYPRFGYHSPFYYGWDDPFWYGGYNNSYVEYHSEVDLHIRAAGTNQPLFDGRAQALTAGMLFAYAPTTHCEMRNDPADPMVKFFLTFTGAEAPRRLRR